jgi:hypothetical protein
MNSGNSAARGKEAGSKKDKVEVIREVAQRVK